MPTEGSGTIEFDWETTPGSAHMEIENSTYSFYTAPYTGDSAMFGGQIEELDVEAKKMLLKYLHEMKFYKDIENRKQFLSQR